jgi:dTDP-4-amino-4,6-dideoxygalactose transaminase
MNLLNLAAGNEATGVIPFNKPAIVGRELYYIAQSIMINQHAAGDGPFTRQCREFLQDHFQLRTALLTTSCTTALELSALLLNIQPGDEVILPSYTFVSTANAFVLRGAKPVFVDIRPDTLNIDESKVEAAITPRTKAICVVHYAGVACEMDALLAIAEHHGIPLVEDAAQAVSSRYKGRYLGGLGVLGAYSFHETKNFICGEGGALVVNDPAYVERAEILREKGTNRSKFFRGEVDKYTWVDQGSSALSSDILAAYLFAQLERHEEITERRKAIYDRYAECLGGLERRECLKLPYVPAECDSNYHMFHIRTRDADTRSALLQKFRDARIHAVFHYVPLHTSPMGQELGWREGELPVTEQVSDTLIRLPFYFDLSTADQDRVLNVLHDFYGRDA